MKPTPSLEVRTLEELKSERENIELQIYDRTSFKLRGFYERNPEHRVRVIKALDELMTSSDIRTSFDFQRARKLRTKLGLPQKVLAQQLEIAPSALCEYENGNRYPNSAEILNPGAKRYITWLKLQGYDVLK